MWPLLPLLAIRWMALGGWRWTWDEFLVHLAGDCEKDDRGNPSIIYFCSMHDFVHFHPLVWGGWALSAYLYWRGPAAADAAGLWLIALLLWSGLTVTLDIPFRRAVKVAVIIALIVGADLGLKFGAERLDAVLAASNYPRVLSWAERGLLHPLWDLISGIDTSVSVGFLMLFSTIWTLVVAYHVVSAVLFNRYGFDGEHLIHWVLGEEQKMTPVYYQKTVLRQRDLLEGAFGFASMTIGTGKGESITLDNIPFMALNGRQAQLSHIIANKAVDPSEVVNGDTSGNPGALRNPRRLPEDAGDAAAAG